MPIRLGLIDVEMVTDRSDVRALIEARRIVMAKVICEGCEDSSLEIACALVFLDETEPIMLLCGGCLELFRLEIAERESGV